MTRTPWLALLLVAATPHLAEATPPPAAAAPPPAAATPPAQAAPAGADAPSQAAATPTPAASARPKESSPTFEFGRFGTVTVYPPAGVVKHVALFVSGDGGWKLGVLDMAHDVQALDTLVLGIDILHYFKAIEAAPEECTYAAADFEALSQYAQKKLGLPSYHVPILVGYSSGATLVYALLVQAPPNTFLGAIALGFCPDLEIGKPFCKGHGLTWTSLPKGKHGFYFLPSSTLEAPFVAMQGSIDQVCDPPSTKAFIAQVTNGETVELPKVGHGYSVPRNWLPQFKEAYLRVAARETPGAPAPFVTTVTPTPAEAQPAPPQSTSTQPTGTTQVETPHGGPFPADVDVSDLPLVPVAASGARTDTAAIMISGDGGWASLDREIAGVLAARGVPVVGLNSLQYLWNAKTPETVGRDFERIARHALATTGAAKLLLAGYSLGADILPFAAARLPEELRQRVSLVALLGPSPTVTFEFHLSNWLGGSDGKDALRTRPEVDQLAGLKVLCAYGSEEKDSLCPSLDPARTELLKITGAHHFGGDYKGMAEALLKAAGVTTVPAAQ
jgi:type IV secretory pathway VirJ component